MDEDGQLQLIAASWIVTGIEPISHVADVPRSVAWFQRAGFEVSFHDDSYAFAHRERDLTFHIARADPGKSSGDGVLYLECQDPDRVAEDWRTAELVVDGPRNEDYGKREDPSSTLTGNVIRFGSPVR